MYGVHQLSLRASTAVWFNTAAAASDSMRGSCREEPLSETLTLPFESYKVSGPPTRPLRFPTPTIHKAAFLCIPVVDLRHGTVEEVSALCKASTTTSGVVRHSNSDEAYQVKSRIAKGSNGPIYLCAVLRRRQLSGIRCGDDDDDDDVPALWYITNDVVALKCCHLSKQNQYAQRGPIHEAACLQLLGNYEMNVLGCFDVLRDESHLYLVLPYCTGGKLICRKRLFPYRYSHQKKLQQQVEETTSCDTASSCDETVASSSTCTTSVALSYRHSLRDNIGGCDTQARMWFRQLLRALRHLQTKGICHGNLNSSKILLEDNDNLVIVGFGQALRIPYQDRSNNNCVADVSEGRQRLLVRNHNLRQSTRQQQPYVAPEVLDCDLAVDGFAVDLWSAGVILYVLLVGKAPFRIANITTDERYREINNGQLKSILTKDRADPVSDNVCNLLQNMMWRDPDKRLSLNQVMQHPWVTGRFLPCR